MAYWNTVEFKAKSERQRVNKRANPFVHTSGSRSHLETRRIMEERLGRTVTPLELHIETHTHGPERQFVDKRSADIAARSEQLLTQRSSQSDTPLSFEDQCEVFLEAVGGVGSGGAVSGLGFAALQYFGDRLRAPRRDASRVGEIQQENQQLRAEVAELQADVAELRSAQVAILQFMEEMRAN